MSFLLHAKVRVYVFMYVPTKTRSNSVNAASSEKDINFIAFVAVFSDILFLRCARSEQ